LKTYTTAKKIFSYVKDCKKAPDFPNMVECNNILKALQNREITQLIFDYKTETIKCLLQYFESIEYYEMCAMIKKDLDEFNRVVGDEKINIYRGQ